MTPTTSRDLRLTKTQKLVIDLLKSCGGESRISRATFTTVQYQYVFSALRSLHQRQLIVPVGPRHLNRWKLAIS